jgi:hypothetical protein
MSADSPWLDNPVNTIVASISNWFFMRFSRVLFMRIFYSANIRQARFSGNYQFMGLPRSQAS